MEETEVTVPADAVTLALAYNINSVIGTCKYVSEVRLKPKWSGKKWVVFGDSLTEANFRTTKHYFDYVSKKTGIDIVNMGDSGSGYAKEREDGTAFFQRIGNVPTDADVITIFGSFNDRTANLEIGNVTDTGTETIAGCMNTTISNLFMVYPLAIVGVVTPTPWMGINPYNGIEWGNQYVDMLLSIAKRWGIPALDLYHNSLLRPWDVTYRALCYSKDNGDGTHPDETGHKIIAPRFEEFLNSLLGEQGTKINDLTMSVSEAAELLNIARGGGES